MFRKYHQQFWTRNSRSGHRHMFDPKKIAMKRIQKIDENIKSREKIEQDHFDKAFAEELAKL